jgi:hypothetical protein
MLADFGWKIESAGNWLKIKYYLYFDYVSQKTLMIMIRFLYRKPNSGLQLLLGFYWQIVTLLPDPCGPTSTSCLGYPWNLKKIKWKIVDGT